MTSSFSAVQVRELTPYGAPDTDGARFFLLRVEHPRDAAGQALWANWKPGQFAMLRPAGWSFELPWARPLSIGSVDDETLTFFFQVAGRGTTRMGSLKVGDSIHLWGPLGNGFAVEPNVPALLLAGGIGLVPFVGYCRQHPAPEQLHLLFAHRPPVQCYPLELFHTVSPQDRPEHSDADRENFLAEVAEQMIATAERSGLVLACGPTPFLQYVRTVALKHDCRTQLSLENRMACGMGACLGCVTTPTPEHPTNGETLLPVRTCTSGPVFWADQITL